MAKTMAIKSRSNIRESKKRRVWTTLPKHFTSPNPSSSLCGQRGSDNQLRLNCLIQYRDSKSVFLVLGQGVLLYQKAMSTGQLLQSRKSLVYNAKWRVWSCAAYHSSQPGPCSQNDLYHIWAKICNNCTPFNCYHSTTSDALYSLDASPFKREDWAGTHGSHRTL